MRFWAKSCTLDNLSGAFLVPRKPLTRSSTRVSRFKRGQGSCSFHSSDEEETSPGSPYRQMRPAEVPLSIQLLKMQEPCPPPLHIVSVYSCHSGWNPLFITTVKAAGALLEWPDLKEGRAPASSTAVMKRGFHQVLHIYKWDLPKFPFQYNCWRCRSPALLFYMVSLYYTG